LEVLGRRKGYMVLMLGLKDAEVLVVMLLPSRYDSFTVRLG
jgi:hypothetical protein